MNIVGQLINKIAYNWYKHHQTKLPKGLYHERLAAYYLKSRGLTLLHQNYRTPVGEIDLVMMHQQQLIFVEVKYRHSYYAGGAIRALSLSQHQRIQRAAHYYIKKKQLLNYSYRIDLIAFTAKEPIRWFHNI